LFQSRHKHERFSHERQRQRSRRSGQHHLQNRPAGFDRDAVTQLAAKFDDAKLPLALLYGFGAAALGTGGTFLLLDWMDKDETTRASLRVSPTGATVRFDW
jgi:hypothetical protein